MADHLTVKARLNLNSTGQIEFLGLGLSLESAKVAG